MKFIYSALDNFKQNLGEYNYVINSNELANQLFIDTYTKSSVITELAEKYSLNINSTQYFDLLNKTPHLYIVSVYQQTEVFFKGFKSEFCSRNKHTWENPHSEERKRDAQKDEKDILRILNKKNPSTDNISLLKELKEDGFTFNRERKNKRKSENLLDGIIRNIAAFKNTSIDVIKDEIGQDVYSCFQYYRQIRNKFIHFDDDADKKLKQYKEDAEKHWGWCAEQFGIRYGLNPYKTINIKDYHLFSAIAIFLGHRLSDIGKPPNKFLAAELKSGSILKNKIKAENNLKKHTQNFNRLMSRKKRRNKALRNMIKIYFGDLREEDILNIITILEEN